MIINRTLGNKEMYDYFRFNYCKAKSKIEELKKSQSKLKKELTTGFYKKLAKTSLDCSYNKYLILLNNKKFNIENIKFKEVNVYHMSNYPKFLMLVKKLNSINYDIAINNSIVNNLKNRNITLNKFSFVLSCFNLLLSEELIRGTKFLLGNNLGTMYIKNRMRKESKMKVDRRLSHILKQDILSKNKIPKSKMFPNGEDWVVYKHLDNNYNWLVWEKTSNLTNNYYYKFSASSYLPDKIEALENKYKTIKEVCMDKIGIYYKIHISNLINPSLKLKYVQW